MFHDLIGSEPDNWLSIFKTYGLFLVLAILVASWIFRRALARQAAAGVYTPELVQVVIGGPPNWLEVLNNVLFGFLLGYKGIYAFQQRALLSEDPSQVLINLQGSWLGGILFAAIFGGWSWYGYHRKQLPKPQIERQQVFPHERIPTITILAAVGGVVGAKIFSILENLDTFFADPLGTFFSGSGLTIYGGLLGGFLLVAWYLRKHKIPLLPALDAVAPALIIAYGVGRIGCHLSGDGDWGIPNPRPVPDTWFLPDGLWSYTYPHNVLQEGVPIEGCTWHYCMELAQGVYPTAVYETLMAFAIGAILMALRSRLAAIPGQLFAVYMMFNGLERFFIEKIRVNERYDWFFGATQAEVIAVVVFLLGVGGFFWLRRGRK